MVNALNVPAELRHLIPLAKRFGVTDDLDREHIVTMAAHEELDRLHQAIVDHNDLLDAWLAGPESSGPSFTNEYIMFSAMRMAADYATCP